MAKRLVAASIVREWAKSNLDSIDPKGHVSLSETARGRLHPEVVTAFNRAHKNMKYGQGTPNPTTLITETVMVESKNGRKVPKRVTLTPEEVKSLTGHKSRGRIPNSVKAQAAALKAQA